MDMTKAVAATLQRHQDEVQREKFQKLVSQILKQSLQYAWDDRGVDLSISESSMEDLHSNREFKGHVTTKQAEKAEWQLQYDCQVILLQVSMHQKC